MCSFQEVSGEGSTRVGELQDEASGLGPTALATPAAALPPPPTLISASPQTETPPAQRLHPQLERAWSTSVAAGRAVFEGARHIEGDSPGAAAGRKRSAAEMEQRVYAGMHDHSAAGLPASSSLLNLAVAAESDAEYSQVPPLQLQQEPHGAAAALAGLSTAPHVQQFGTPPGQLGLAWPDVFMGAAGSLPAAQPMLQPSDIPAMRRAACLADAGGSGWLQQLPPALDARTPPRRPKQAPGRAGSRPTPPRAGSRGRGRGGRASSNSSRVVQQALQLQQKLLEQRQGAKELARQQVARLPLAAGLGKGAGVARWAGAGAGRGAAALVGLHAVAGSALEWRLRFLACPAASTVGAMAEVRGSRRGAGLRWPQAAQAPHCMGAAWARPI